MTFNERLDLAVSLAADYHAKQTRKPINGISFPYIVHPLSVAKTLWQFGVDDDDTLVSAILHDILEDTSCPKTFIERTFGQFVLDIIEELTFVPTVHRDKNEYLQSFSTKSVNALVIKVVDRIDNVKDFLITDPVYAQKYYAKASCLFNTLHSRQDEVVGRFGAELAGSLYGEIIKLEPILEA